MNEIEEIHAIMDRCHAIGTSAEWTLYCIAKKLAKLGQMSDEQAEQWRPKDA